MTSLYTEAVACTEGQEQARTLLESIRAQAAELSVDTSTKRLELANELAIKAIRDLKTRAVVIDDLLAEGITTSDSVPYICQPLASLETLDKQFASRWDWDLFAMMVKKEMDRWWTC